MVLVLVLVLVLVHKESILVLKGSVLVLKGSVLVLILVLEKARTCPALARTDLNLTVTRQTVSRIL